MALRSAWCTSYKRVVSEGLFPYGRFAMNVALFYPFFSGGKRFFPNDDYFEALFPAGGEWWHWGGVSP